MVLDFAIVRVWAILPKFHSNFEQVSVGLRVWLNLFKSEGRLSVGGSKHHLVLSPSQLGVKCSLGSIGEVLFDNDAATFDEENL